MVTNNLVVLLPDVAQKNMFFSLFVALFVVQSGYIYQQYRRVWVGPKAFFIIFE